MSKINVFNDTITSDISDEYLDMVSLLSNETIDYEAVEKTLRLAISKNFKYLYNAQKEADGVEKYCFKMADLSLSTRLPIESNRSYHPKRYTLNIESTLVDSVHMLDARQDGVFNKLITNEDITEGRYKFIDKNYMVFINNKLIDTTEIIDRNSNIVLIIDVADGIHTDGIPLSDFNNYMNENASITVFILPINLSGPRYLVNGDNPWFQLTGYNTPVPIHSLIPILNDDTKISPADIEFKLYYPNIYEVKGLPEDESLSVVVIHRELYGSSYDNHLSLYHKYSTGLLDSYRNLTIPDIIKNYSPEEVILDMDIDGFKESGLFPNRMLYDIKLFQDYTKTDYHLFIQYMYLKLRSKIRFYVDMSKVDLITRIKYNNYGEIPKVLGSDKDRISFDKPHYIISLTKVLFGDGLSFRLYLDNYFLSPYEYEIYETPDWFHMYIPCDKIKENSILEIEKFRNFSEEVGFTYTGDLVEISIPEHINHVGLWNINVYDLEIGDYIDKDYYEIIGYNSILDEYVTLNTRGYATITNNFFIKVINPDYINRPLVVSMVSVSHIRTSKTKDGDDSTNLIVYDNMNFTRDNFRIYKNGRLAPNKFLYTRSDEAGKRGAKFDAIISMSTTDDDLFVVDILPIKFIKEFSIIGEFNSNGLIDTGYKLSLPFDLKWYDVFVNGIKLNKSNVEVISPNKFIIKGIKTHMNLEIFLRQDCYESSKFTSWNETMDDEIFNIQEIQDAILNSAGILSDEIPDIMDDYVENLMILHLNFVDEILKYIFINPNITQLNEYIKAIYPDFFDENDILWLDCNSNPDAEIKTIINSNARYAIMKQGQYRYGFTPLHIGSHEDAKNGEYLCDPLTGLPGMKTAEGTILAGANINRLNDHKSTFMNTLALNGLSDRSIYNLEFDENTTAKKISIGTNMLDSGNNFTLVEKDYIKDVVLSLDIDVLEVGYNDVLRPADCDLSISATFTTSTGMIAMVLPLSSLSSNVTPINGNGLKLNDLSIIAPSDYDTQTLNGYTIILNSILIAF